MAEEMFKLTVEFSTENAAFGEDKDFEILHILKRIVEKIHRGYTNNIIQDSNGNTIGRWYLGDDYTPVDDATTEINL